MMELSETASRLWVIQTNASPLIGPQASSSGIGDEADRAGPLWFLLLHLPFGDMIGIFRQRHHDRRLPEGGDFIASSPAVFTCLRPFDGRQREPVSAGARPEASTPIPGRCGGELCTEPSAEALKPSQLQEGLSEVATNAARRTGLFGSSLIMASSPELAWAAFSSHPIKRHALAIAFGRLLFRDPCKIKKAP